MDPVTLIAALITALTQLHIAVQAKKMVIALTERVDAQEKRLDKIDPSGKAP